MHELINSSFISSLVYVFILISIVGFFSYRKYGVLNTYNALYKLSFYLSIPFLVVATLAHIVVSFDNIVSFNITEGIIKLNAIIEKDLSNKLNIYEYIIRFPAYAFGSYLIYKFSRSMLFLDSNIPDLDKKSSSLEESIKKYTKVPKKWRKKNSLTNKTNKLMFLLMIAFVFFNAYHFIKIIYTDFVFFETISRMLAIIGGISSATAFYILQKKPPKYNTNQWIWRKGRIAFIAFVYGSLLVTIALLIDNTLLSPVQLNLLVTSQIIFISLNLIVLYTAKKPFNLIKGKLTHIGTYIAFYSFILAPFSVIVYPRLGIFSLLILILLVYFTTKVATLSIEKRLNVIQLSVIKFSRPDLILEVFMTEKEKIKNEIKALKILNKIDKDDKFGIEKILLEKLTKKYSDKKVKIHSILISLIITLLITAITTIIQLIIQDTIYFPVIKKYICNILDCS